MYKQGHWGYTPAAAEFIIYSVDLLRCRNSAQEPRWFGGGQPTSTRGEYGVKCAVLVAVNVICGLAHRSGGSIEEKFCTRGQVPGRMPWAPHWPTVHFCVFEY